MSIVLMGSTSGSATLQEQAVAGNTTLTLPTITGTVGVLVSGTAVASTSGTSIDFTGLPAGVRRITVVFTGVSTNGTSQLQVQLGSGSFSTSGYTSFATTVQTSNTTSGNAVTSGFHTFSQSASSSKNGQMVLLLISGNSWISNHVIADNGLSASLQGGGALALGGALDRIRITTVNGTDTFDAGSINILYE
jgi:hypothetical protein